MNNQTSMLYITDTNSTLWNKRIKAFSAKPNSRHCYAQRALWATLYNTAPESTIRVFTDTPKLYSKTRITDVAKYAITHGCDCQVYFVTEGHTFALQAVATRTRLEDTVETITARGKYGPFKMTKTRRNETPLQPGEWQEVEDQLYPLKRFCNILTNDTEQILTSQSYAECWNLSLDPNDKHYVGNISQDTINDLQEYVNIWGPAYDIEMPKPPKKSRMALKDYAHFYLKAEERANIDSLSEDANCIKKRDSIYLDYITELTTAYQSLKTYRKNNFPLAFGWIECPHCSRPINSEGRESRLHLSQRIDWEDQLHKWEPDEECPHCGELVTHDRQLTACDIKKTCEYGKLYIRDTYLDEWYDKLDNVQDEDLMDINLDYYMYLQHM